MHCKCKDQNTEVDSKCMPSLPGGKGGEAIRPPKEKFTDRTPAFSPI